MTGLRPDMFENFFRLHATGPDGRPMLLDRRRGWLLIRRRRRRTRTEEA